MQEQNLKVLIIQNMNIVKAIAKRYAGEGIELDDLIQEGVIGIMQAAENYKPNFNVSFPSYAGKWIKSRIKRAAAKDRAIQIPEHIQRAYTKITMTYRSLEQSTKHIPSANDIAYELGMDEEEVKNIICIMCNVQEVYSLNSLIDGDESDDEIIDYVPASLKVYGKAKPVYRYFDGWKEDISNIRKFEDLPENCQKYVRFIEEYTGTTVSLVSVSPERSGNIILKELL